MSNISIIATVTSDFPDKVVFANTETASNNRSIEKGQTVSPGAWVPWCDSSEVFPFHHLALTAHDNTYYIYQSGPSVYGSKYFYGKDADVIGKTGDTLRLKIDNAFNVTATT